MSGKPAHVLVVEDDEARAGLIRWAFRDRADAVALTVVGTLREARASIVRRAPDLAIVGLHLPDGPGTDLLPADGSDAPFPVVIMAARGDERAAAEAMEAGALDYVPVSAPALADMPHAAERALREWGHRTARKRLERQLRHAMRMEAIGRLVGGIAHDFNGMLTVVEMYSSSLLQEPGLSDRVRHDVEEIAKAGRRAASLTRRLLLFSRRRDGEPTRLDLNVVVGNVERLLCRLIGEDVSVVIRPASGPAWVRADLGLLELALMNLTVNARDAMPSGGVLTLEVANVQLDEAHAQAHPGARPGPHVMLTVGDTGTGMDEGTLLRIFEPFFTTKEPAQGTGLGLSTARGAIAQSGGHITVDSTPGLGSTFRIYLPGCQEGVDARQHAQAGQAPVRGSETILVVEDEHQMRRSLCHALRRFGYTVLDAADAEEAMRVCQGHTGPIHLLFTDVVMPGMSGTNLAHRIGALRPDTQILYMSGYPPGTAPRQEAARPGASFIQKPFPPEALALKVREALGPPSDA